MRKTIALLLAGGVGSRLSVLAQVRAKPAVTFGGKYRIIDCTLSNVTNSGIENVGILTQYKPYSLMKHIGNGEAWDFIGRTRFAKILPPKTGLRDNDWYRGTADAVSQNLDYIDRFNSKRVLILSGDHIYYMDYAKLVDFHKSKNALLTIATRIVPLEMASEFGIAQVDDDSKIINWEEKPEKPKSNLASMGVYVFNTDFLKKCLQAAEGFDFGKHVIPWALKNYEAYAYPFDSFWQDVGTIKSFWDANMNLLKADSGINLAEWKIRTNVVEEEILQDRMPAYLSPTAKVRQSIISLDCYIAGEVVNSILSPGVRIAEGAKVSSSVIMHDTFVGKYSELNQVITDKGCRIRENCVIGSGEDSRPNEEFPKYLHTGITLVGKLAEIPANCKVGSNSLIFNNVKASDFQHLNYPAGSTIFNTEMKPTF